MTKEKKEKEEELEVKSAAKELPADDKDEKQNSYNIIDSFTCDRTFSYVLQ